MQEANIIRKIVFILVGLLGSGCLGMGFEDYSDNLSSINGSHSSLLPKEVPATWTYEVFRISSEGDTLNVKSVDILFHSVTNINISRFEDSDSFLFDFLPSPTDTAILSGPYEVIWPDDSGQDSQRSLWFTNTEGLWEIVYWEYLPPRITLLVPASWIRGIRWNDTVDSEYQIKEVQNQIVMGAIRRTVRINWNHMPSWGDIYSVWAKDLGLIERRIEFLTQSGPLQSAGHEHWILKEITP